MAASLYLNQTPPNPWWLSPALSVVKVGLTNLDGGTPLLDVVPSATVSQHARGEAGNDGTTDATDVHVQLWAHVFATAASPSLWLASLGGIAGVSIPAGTGATIEDGQEQPFDEPWDAGSGLTTAELGPLLNDDGQLHCCMFGNVYSPTDGQVVTDPTTLQPATNRHHAQRNMTISPLNTPAVLNFMLFAGNPDPEREQDARLEVAEITPRKLPNWQLAELDRLGPWIRRTRRTPDGGLPGIEFVIDGKPQPVRTARRPLRDLAIAVDDAGEGRAVKLELGVEEARRLHICAELPDQEFVLRMFDVTQFAGDRQVGGVRVMALAVPEELLKKRVKRG
ncbi:hypothetical protein DVA67_011280 [Solirubrobacter sp. CPCC 204708]|uniref:DUF2169 domain-containing protein n=1 Tax=Solirubrobacter deserti TaxID=2282478 RepID=A0ABT4RHX6_9ACTN|nr:hypothetical protein [Solirubrobacter deserti]MBE2316561.1 hypothetical protein [Solirubrobacter deserti]MDA0138095.1 hypothetical protein [Solirubrobacter deserti]